MPNLVRRNIAASVITATMGMGGVGVLGVMANNRVNSPARVHTRVLKSATAACQSAADWAKDADSQFHPPAPGTPIDQVALDRLNRARLAETVACQYVGLAVLNYDTQAPSSAALIHQEIASTKALVPDTPADPMAQTHLAALAALDALVK